MGVFGDDEEGCESDLRAGTLKFRRETHFGEEEGD